MPYPVSGPPPCNRFKLCALLCHIGHPVPWAPLTYYSNQRYISPFPGTPIQFEFQWNFDCLIINEICDLSSLTSGVGMSTAERIAWGAWGAAELHPPYCLAALARHPGGSKKGDASRGAEGRRTPSRKWLISYTQNLRKRSNGPPSSSAGCCSTGLASISGVRLRSMAAPGAQRSALRSDMMGKLKDDRRIRMRKSRTLKDDRGLGMDAEARGLCVRVYGDGGKSFIFVYCINDRQHFIRIARLQCGRLRQPETGQRSCVPFSTRATTPRGTTNKIMSRPSRT